ncbi:hypothetical protein [Arsenophonus endosymbiont of Bemisia tabaci]
MPTYSPDLNPIEHKWAQAIAKRLNFDYKIYVFIQYKFIDIE